MGTRTITIVMLLCAAAMLSVATSRPPTPAVARVVDHPDGAAAAAPSGAYQYCWLKRGRVKRCSGFVRGTAVAQNRGAYRVCSVRDGKLVTCGQLYSGYAVLHRAGAYRSCRIKKGRVVRCDQCHTGTVALFR